MKTIKRPTGSALHNRGVVFASLTAPDFIPISLAMTGWIERITNTMAPSKEKLPLVKLAECGFRRSRSGIPT